MRKLEQFLFFSEAAFNILSKTEPTMYSTFPGYVWLAEAYLMLIQDPSYLEDGKLPFNKNKIKEKIKRTLGFLARFAVVFTMASPRSDLLEGLCCHGNQRNH